MIQKPFTSTSSAAKQQTPASNPFARALAETEHSSYQQTGTATASNPFSEALAQAGGSLADQSMTPGFNQAEQQRKLEEQRKKEFLRKKLHDQINQTTQAQEVFSAREKQVKQEIEKLREDLKMLALDVKKFEKEVEITLMTEIVEPGQQGTYYKTFFQQLRAFIMLLRQKIKSARTWATQMHGKKKKRKSKQPGLEIAGKQHEQTSTVFDMMHHERSSTYSGS